MTRKEFFSGNKTWKGVQLRALVKLYAKPLSYNFFRLNVMVNCETMFVKSALFNKGRIMVQSRQTSGRSNATRFGGGSGDTLI